MPSSKHRRRGKLRRKPQRLQNRTWGTVGLMQHQWFIDRAEEMYGDYGTLTKEQRRAVIDRVNAYIESWNAMEAICCDALGVEVPWG